jgi:ankyrin repeat protein
MGQTAMHIAALWGSYEVAEKLIHLGANVNIENTRY